MEPQVSKSAAETNQPTKEQPTPKVDITETSFPPAYHGNATLEERIAVADVIAHVRLLTIQPSAEKYDPVAFKGQTTPVAEQPFTPALRFTFDVVEYLKSGDNPPNRLTAMVGSLDRYDMESEALTAAGDLLTQRNTQWDTREAIIFLTNESTAYPATSASDLYFMSLLDFGRGFGDMYSVASERNRIWLPSTTTANAQVSGELRFYLEEPGSSPVQASSRQGNSAAQSTSTAQTIALSALRTNIASVNTMLGTSRAQEICVLLKLKREREWSFLRALGDEPISNREFHKTLESGQPAGTVVFLQLFLNLLIDGETLSTVEWFEGKGADLIRKGEVISSRTEVKSLSNSFHASGGRFHYTREWATHPWETVRPVPQGIYNLRWKQQGALRSICDTDTDDTNWDFPMTIQVDGPQGALHEALFDPLTDGSAIAADSTIGKLEPASFTVANGNPATIHRISYDSGGVTTTISPVTVLTGHRLDFIELDGSTSLSLQADDAIRDSDNHTLAWPMSEQPWHDGDLLMLRITRVVP